MLSYRTFLLPITPWTIQIMYHADLVISGGGSMNREAAVLGTPTYSLFKGKLAAVDRYLMDKGRIQHIDTLEEIGKIPVVKKQKHRKMNGNANLVQEVANSLTQQLR